MPESRPAVPTTFPAMPIAPEVRYSLPELLREVEQERRESAFAMESLDQMEISKLYTRRGHRRVRTRKTS